MFCSKCGCKLNEGAVFCHGCGTRVGSLTQNNHSPIQEPRNTELNREALKIYLYDVLTLECIKNKYLTKLNSIRKKISSTGDNYFEKKYQLVFPESWCGGCNYLYFLYMDGKFYLWVKNDSLYGTHAYIDDIGYRMPCRDQDFYTKKYHPDNYFLDIEQNYKMISGLSMWSSWPITCESNFFGKRKKATKARDAFLRCYADFKQTAAPGFQENGNHIKRLEKVQAGINKELAAVNRLLSQEYSLNIIPSQFRNNLYAVYYLYDFISSSNQSFTTALLHFDLHDIKMKLDKIIQQQQEIIIQQALVIAQNQQMIAQNQACLRKLSNLERTAVNIENNTAQAATYASIAANNTEVCAWIGLANYLKD